MTAKKAEKVTAKSAYGYLRKSPHTEGGNVSREDQIAALYSLAKQHDVRLDAAHILDDWSRSGDDERIKNRTGFKTLLRRIEEGKVSHVFAQRLDRLGRGQSALAVLWAAAETTGTKVITRDEGDLTDTKDPNKWMYRHMLSGFAELYIRHQKRKADSTLAFQRKRDDYIGQPTLGHEKRRDESGRVLLVKTDPDAISVVVDTYRDVGTFLGTAKRLNGAHIPAPSARQRRANGEAFGKGKYAKAQWHAITVKRIIQREAPHLAPRHRYQRRKPQHHARLFAGLLRCHCGQFLTPGGSDTQRWFGYFCAKAHRDAEHSRPYYVSEKRLRPWAEAEASRMRLDARAMRTAEDAEGERKQLEARRQRIAKQHEAGLIDDDEMVGQTKALKSDIADLDARSALSVSTIPDSLDWERPTEEVNEVLRALWSEVMLDAKLDPIEAVWYEPSLRGEPAA